MNETMIGRPGIPLSEGQAIEQIVLHELPAGADVRAHVCTSDAVYLAVRDTDGISAYVVAYEVHGHLVHFNTLHETEHPYYYDCPAAVLDKLDPPRSPEAVAWRAGCRQREQDRTAPAETVRFVGVAITPPPFVRASAQPAATRGPNR